MGTLQVIDHFYCNFDISEFLQIRILLLVIILLVSGYQPRLTQFQEDIAYF